eukprot:TRINITY_DN56017_c0_g1_i1.p1 TRINITY_DN56017_c0_g1~~TRINITY_DN56017_c0_g1_i1.p1  ORF type:complete len:425 (+),score=47.69 TRINITY_DN56017_c0_g1_i1:128-1276(+)
MDALSACYAAKCAEEELVRAHLDAVRIDLQFLRIRLQAATGQETSSLIPGCVRAGAVRSITEVRCADYKSMLEWLAKVVDTSESVEFFANGNLIVSSHCVTLGWMVQFRLVSLDGLKLTVPSDSVQEFLEILFRTRSGILGESDLLQISALWEFVCTEMSPDGQTPPAIFLIHRESLRAICVAPWPLFPNMACVETQATSFALEVLHFDPRKHFGLGFVGTTLATKLEAEILPDITFVDGDGAVIKLTPANDRGMQWHVNGSTQFPVEELSVHFPSSGHCTITGPSPALVAVPQHGEDQRKLARSILIMAMRQRVRVRCNSMSMARVPSAREEVTRCEPSLESAKELDLLTRLSRWACSTCLLAITWRRHWWYPQRVTNGAT